MSVAPTVARAVALVLSIFAIAVRTLAADVAERVDVFAQFAVSGPDGAAIRAFVEENWAASALAARPAESRAASLERVFRDLAGGTVESILVASPTEAKIVARNAARDLWFEFDVELEPAAPRKVVGVGIKVDQQPPGGGEPEPSGEGGPLSEAEARQLVAAEIERRAAEDRFSGVLVVEQAGRRLFEHAAGWADRENRIPVTIDTKFGIASIGKSFTEVVVRQLAAEGLLDLSAPLAQVLPDYPNRDVAARVTPAQLLDHSSGLGDFTEALYSPRGAALGSPRALSDYLPLFVDEPLRFEPGSRSRYSNSGYLVLGLVIEKLTGESYFDAVRRRVFAPAGMTDSGWAAASERVPGRAIGYFRGAGPGGPLRANTAVERGAGTSAGGGYSTAADLLRFAEALASGKLLPAGASPLTGGAGIAGGTPAANAVLVWGGSSAPRLVALANLGEPSAESLERFTRQVLARIR